MTKANPRKQRPPVIFLIATVFAIVFVQIREQSNMLLLFQQSRHNADHGHNPISTNDNLSLIKATDSKKVSSLNFCSRSELPVDEPKKTMHQILYQCAGDEYERFVEILRIYVSENQTSTWGKRAFPLPANKTVLMIGNSHTRQAGNALWCQYADLVNHSASYEDQENISLTFENGSTLLMVANAPVVYSRNWDKLVEKYLHRNLSSIDAIVLGQFNNFDPNHLNSKFIQRMLNYSEAHDELDFEHIEGPTLRVVAKRFSGPIITVSMFGKDEDHFDSTSLSTMEQLKAVTNRSNFRFVSGKKHIRETLPCGAGSWRAVSICQANAKTHQCVGDKGGHADLIAWDIIENLHDILS